MNKDAKFVLKLGIILFVICAICVFTLALCNSLTKDTIAKINLEKQEDAQRQVLSDAKNFEKIEFNGNEEVYVGKDGEKEVGYCIKVVPKGYGGDIEMMVGVDNSLNVTGVSIINMSETAGLGSKANKKEFTNQYNGLTNEISVIKNGSPKGNEIVAISGATVTSKAVTKGVNRAITIAQSIKGAEK